MLLQSRFYQRPENALKRAEGMTFIITGTHVTLRLPGADSYIILELIAVNQHASALELLHDIVMSKRSRSTPLTTLEPIMMKFVELAVLLRKGKIAKEGLHQFKNISQNITVTSIEVS
jgi:translation initiation factor 3 subunit A